MAAAAQQKVLEHVFGSAAARTLIAKAKERLHESLHGVLHTDGARFYDLTDQHSPDPAAAAGLRLLSEEVERQARAFHG